MTENAYFIGVDGGGTCSKAVLMDRNCGIRRRAQGDCLNYYSIEISSAKAHFRALMEELIKDDDPDLVNGVFIGMSALDAEEAPERAADFLGDLFPNARVFMNSDLYIALMGYTLGEPGLMVVSGTGAMAVALGADGKEYVAGGYGYLLGDQGSAYTIAVDALRSALLAFEGITPGTLLQGEMMSYFELAEHRQLIDVVYASPNPRKLLSSFAQRVSVAAAAGDQKAVDILRQNAKSLADMADALISRAGLSGIDRIGVYGSVFLNDPIIRRHFAQCLLKRYPNIVVETPDILPEDGAAIMAMRRLMPDRPIPADAILRSEAYSI